MLRSCPFENIITLYSARLYSLGKSFQYTQSWWYSVEEDDLWKKTDMYWLNEWELEKLESQMGIGSQKRLDWEMGTRLRERKKEKGVGKRGRERYKRMGTNSELCIRWTKPGGWNGGHVMTHRLSLFLSFSLSYTLTSSTPTPIL